MIEEKLKELQDLKLQRETLNKQIEIKETALRELIKPLKEFLQEKEQIEDQEEKIEDLKENIPDEIKDTLRFIIG